MDNNHDITVTFDYDVYYLGSTDSHGAPIFTFPVVLTGQEAIEFLNSGFDKMDAEQQLLFLLDHNYQYVGKDGKKYDLIGPVLTAVVNCPKNVSPALITHPPKATITVNGEKTTIENDELEEYLSNPNYYATRVYENKEYRNPKIDAKNAQDKEFYVNNAYNKKYVSRASEINNIMLDEADYEKVMDKMKENESHYENAIATIKTTASTASSYGFECSSKISGHEAVITAIKAEETQLTNRLMMSITVLKNCDMEMKSFLEEMLVSAIFSKDMKEEKYQWETFEKDVDEILEELENDIKAEYEAKEEYARKLWEFSKYYDKDKNQWLFPDDMSPEDIQLIQASIAELSNLPWTNELRVRAASGWGEWTETYTGSVAAFLYKQNYSMWKVGSCHTLNDFDMNGNFLDSGKKERMTLLEYFLNDDYNCFEEGWDKNNYYNTIRLSKKYAGLLGDASELKSAYNIIKSIRTTKVPYMKYTTEDDYKDIYETIRSSNYVGENNDELPINEILKNFGLDSKYADRMEFMSVNEMSTYIYLLKHSGEPGVKSASDYKTKLNNRVLKQREADYIAYDELTDLLADGDISWNEFASKTLDGAGDGLMAWLLGFQRIFSPLDPEKGYEVDELKEKKLAEMLATFPCGSSKEDVQKIYDMYKDGYDRGGLTDAQFKAIDTLHDYITNNGVAYEQIATYNALYNGASNFTNKVPTITVKILGDVLAPYTGNVSKAVADIICAAQQFGECTFKELQASNGNIAGSVLNGIFGAINSKFINKFAKDTAKEIFDTNSFVQLMSRTLTRESIKSVAKTIEDTAVNLVEGEFDVEINLPKFVKNIDKVINKSLPKLREGKITWNEFMFDCIKVVEPYLYNFVLYGTTFDGTKNGLKFSGQNAATELAKEGYDTAKDYYDDAFMAFYMVMDRLRQDRSVEQDKL